MYSEVAPQKNPDAFGADEFQPVESRLWSAASAPENASRQPMPLATFPGVESLRATGVPARGLCHGPVGPERVSILGACQMFTSPRISFSLPPLIRTGRSHQRRAGYQSIAPWPAPEVISRGDQPGAIGRKDHVEQGTAMPMEREQLLTAPHVPESGPCPPDDAAHFKSRALFPRRPLPNRLWSTRRRAIPGRSASSVRP